ncbi:chymotrypsin inhibitor [Diachasma alloeum]|uniref:chymotrypsin inhibitor n=1 Tax=Diachasma alloeum TaxID=454923 RepID=UPI0007383495|nr:chymotrypsin inhibitor [Diachasma alloeum]
MFRVGFHLILAVAIVGITGISAQECPPGEFFNSCGSCVPTCARPVIEACAAVCYQGCYCNEGLIRLTGGGPCVSPSECPPR